MYYVHYVYRITTEEIGKVELCHIARVEICDIVTEGRDTSVKSSTPDGIIVVQTDSRLLPAGQYGSTYYRNSRIQRVVKHIYQIDEQLFDKEEAITFIEDTLECSSTEANEYIEALPQLTM